MFTCYARYDSHKRKDNLFVVKMSICSSYLNFTMHFTSWTQNMQDSGNPSYLGNFIGFWTEALLRHLSFQGKRWIKLICIPQKLKTLRIVSSTNITESEFVAAMQSSCVFLVTPLLYSLHPWPSIWQIEEIACIFAK